MRSASGESDEVMPKIDLQKDKRKLRSTDLIHMKRVEERNLQRAQMVKTWKIKNNIMASCLMAIVAGIYGYTIFAVKQEKFLDDLEEPEKIVDNPAESRN